MPAVSVPHVLILGGTSEAYALAAALAGEQDLRVTTALAGVTASPRLPAGACRIGGFGGINGLLAYLEAEHVALLVDASHPFAARITANAHRAAAGAGLPYLRLERAPWRPVAGDRWHRVANLEDAIAILPELNAQRVFAALGARIVQRLGDLPCRFVLRGIEPPPDLPSNVTWLGARGPFSTADEHALLAAHRIDALLCRNSGGEATRAKLAAARQLGLPVVMIDRPPAPAVPVAMDVATAVGMVETLLRSARRPAGA